MAKSLDAFVEQQIGKLTLDLLKALTENAQLKEQLALQAAPRKTQPPATTQEQGTS